MSGSKPVLTVALAGLCLLVTRATAEEPPRLSDADFDGLVRRLHVKNQPWATIPWRTSVTAAREEAARDQKPIFLIVNTGNCLGYV